MTSSASRAKALQYRLVSANKDTAKIAQEVGADDFVAKPFDLDELLEKIERYL